MIIKITKLVGTPPKRVESPPVWCSGGKVIRLRSGHCQLQIETQNGRKFIDMPPGTEVVMEVKNG